MQDDNIQLILKNVFAASPHKHIKCNICKYKYSKYVKSDDLYKSDLECSQNVRMLIQKGSQAVGLDQEWLVFIYFTRSKHVTMSSYLALIHRSSTYHTHHTPELFISGSRKM